LTTSQAKPRSEWRVVGTDQVAENGVARNRRRISRLSARAALTMDIVVDIVDEDAAVEDTEDEATVEMANQDVDVVDIEGVVTHKRQCSNCIFADPKTTGRIGLSLRCIKSFLRFAISVDTVQNGHIFVFFGQYPLLSWEIILENRSVAISCLCISLFSFFFATCTTRITDTNEKNEKLRIRLDLSGLGGASAI
jgi:predicted amino acid-binding ACT domain protein